MGKILITGASGLIGTRLTELLVEQGYSVVHLGRAKKKTGIPCYVWDVEKSFIEPGVFEGVDTIIHLAGAGIADKPWTDQRKKLILESRTHSTRLLYREIKKGGHSVKNFIAASAIGFYGFEDNDKLLHENDVAGTDFLAQVVKKWEDEVDQLKTLPLRLVKIRIGIVLSTAGGALKEILKPVKFYAGAPLGSGRQGVSWIHIEDLCRMFLKAVQDEHLQGVYNGVGPYPVTNKELTQAIAKALHKPLFLPPVPGLVLRLLLGEMADLVLKGNKVSAEKITQAGFTFQYKTLDAALANLLTKQDQ